MAASDEERVLYITRNRIKHLSLEFELVGKVDQEDDGLDTMMVERKDDARPELSK